jgi:tetratricopeptide (TPR) repeat protein
VATYGRKLSGTILSLAVIGICCGRNAFAGRSADLDPQAHAAFLTGTADLKRGDFRGAIASFQEVLKIDKTFGPAYLNLGLAYNELKQYERAIPSFSKALELDSQLEGAALFLGIDYCKTGAPEKAIGPLQKALKLTPGDPDAHFWLGKAFLAQEHYQEAIPHLEMASQADPKDIHLQYDLAQAHLLLSNQMLTRISRQNPHTYWPHLLKAQAYGLEGKLDMAVIEYNQVVRLSPKEPGVHEALGEIYLRKRDFASAQAEFRKELDINPTAFTAVCSLADVMIETGKTDEVIPALEKASAQKPSLGCARYELGRARFRQGQYEKAEGHLEMATDLNPTYAPAYVLLGQCYSKLGKLEKARVAFQKSRALNEEHLLQMQQNLAPSEPSTDQPNPQ